MAPPLPNTTLTGGRLSSRQIQCSSPLTRRVPTGTGPESVTSQPRSDTLTTRLPRPYRLAAAVTDSSPECHEFETSSTQDLPCRAGPMHVHYVKAHLVGVIRKLEEEDAVLVPCPSIQTSLKALE
ncbi:hypothetical protein TNCV_2410151 [Trichonephila clavipes]|nr:hypothetical protein TNCV_2410151 [Trichonephila clavipes]